MYVTRERERERERERVGYVDRNIYRERVIDIYPYIDIERESEGERSETYIYREKDTDTYIDMEREIWIGLASGYEYRVLCAYVYLTTVRFTTRPVNLSKLTLYGNL